MTEYVSERYLDLEEWPLQLVVEAIYEAQIDAVAAVRSQIPTIADAASSAAMILAKGGRLLYAGAGTSGRLAVQDGVELKPTYGWPKGRLAFCVAGGFDSLITSIEGAEDSIENAKRDIAQLGADSNDVLIALAASGKTPYTASVVKNARDRGMTIICIVNNIESPLIKYADHLIIAETGSEVIAGSTRMKAGTAQKVVLTMLSTAIMVNLGRTYQGQMVSMDVSNTKLRDRAENIVSAIAGIGVETTRELLDASKNNIRVAILMSKGYSIEESKVLLKKANGNLRVVLEALDSTP